jgi:hypothetical protein
MNINQIRNKYKKEIEIIREKVHEKNLFISLSGIDQIIQLIEKFNLKERSEIQKKYIEKLLDYANISCQNAYERLINEIHIENANQDMNRLEVDLMKKIESVSETEEQPEELESLREKGELSSPEVKMSITQLRSKYKKQIDTIKEKLDIKNLFISLSGIDEIINLFEPLNIEESLMAAYLEELLDSAIRFCEKREERLINESHIKQAILDVNKREIALMKRILPTESVEIGITERQPEVVEISQEVSEVSRSKVEPKKIEVLEEVNRLSTLEEIPTEEEIMPNEIVVDVPEKEPEEKLPSKPQIIDCPFCGLVKNESATFCPQCGMIFKK